MTRPTTTAAVILIAGGTGRLGRETLRLLTNRGLKVRVLTREPAHARDLQGDRVEIVAGDVRNPASLGPALAGVETVISAMSGYGPRSLADPRSVDGEGNRNLIRAAASARTEHFVLISVHAASADHPMELMRMKFLAEQELKRSRLTWTIIGPTPFMETWAKVVGEPLITKGKALVFGQGENPINFVSAHDVALLAEQAVCDPAMRGVEIDAGGPENLTLNQLAKTFAAVTRKTNRRRHIPRPALRLLAVLAKPVYPGLARVAHDVVLMDTLDFRFNPSPASGRSASIGPTSLAEMLKRDYGSKSDDGSAFPFRTA